MLYSFLEGIMWSNHLLLTSPYFVFQHSNWEWYMVLGCSDWSSEGACWYILPGCSSRWHWVILYLASQHVSMRNILFPEWSLISWMLLEFWTLSEILWWMSRTTYVYRNRVTMKCDAMTLPTSYATRDFVIYSSNEYTRITKANKLNKTEKSLLVYSRFQVESR